MYCILRYIEIYQVIYGHVGLRKDIEGVLTVEDQVEHESQTGVAMSSHLQCAQDVYMAIAFLLRSWESGR